MTVRVAFYGKGGIGKSTIAANCSAVLGRKGLKVLHIGCDPKADSTVTLLGHRCQTALQAIAARGCEVEAEDLVHRGMFGVYCTESGGPEAGVGCAGIGISTAMDELQRLKVLPGQWDAVVFDVLGDVVCGGFSVPMRRHYADRVYVVTSAEFMSLYAANNIMKSIQRCDRGGLFGGLIINRRGSERDDETIRLFAKLTKSQVVAVFLQSPLIARSSFLWQPLAAIAPQSDEYGSFEALARRIFVDSGLSSCQPLSDQQMDEFRLTLVKRWGWLA